MMTRSDTSPTSSRRRHILAGRHLHVLKAFTSSNVLVAFDYDGTLAPIVRTPSEARMRPATRRLLAAVAGRYPCMVISGRARRDVGNRLGSTPLLHVAGNHGIEPWGQQQVHAQRVRTWVKQLTRQLAGYRSVFIEDKIYSLTIHFRQAVDRRQALTAINTAVLDLRGARSLGGTCAVSVVPRDAPTKGTVLERVRRLLSCDTAIYVGDDETDEEAFQAGGADRLLAIQVGMRPPSSAGYGLRSQKEIDRLLQTLLLFRPVSRRLRLPPDQSWR